MALPTNLALRGSSSRTTSQYGSCFPFLLRQSDVPHEFILPYHQRQGKLLYCHPPPGMEDEWKQWWDEHNAREQYRSFGWDVKETMRLPDEEESQSFKQRRERQTHQVQIPPLIVGRSLKASDLPTEEQARAGAGAPGRRHGARCRPAEGPGQLHPRSEQLPLGGTRAQDRTGPGPHGPAAQEGADGPVGRFLQRLSATASVTGAPSPDGLPDATRPPALAPATSWAQPIRERGAS